MQINTKGQVTIPVNIREKFGLLPNTEVDFIEMDHKLVLVKKENAYKRGFQIISALRNKGDIRLSTEQIMKLTRE